MPRRLRLTLVLRPVETPDEQAKREKKERAAARKGLKAGEKRDLDARLAQEAAEAEAARGPEFGSRRGGALQVRTQFDERRAVREAEARLREARGGASKNAGRERAAIEEGVAEGRRLLRELAEALVPQLQAQYDQLVPRAVQRRDPVRVRLVPRGDSFTIEASGGPDAQKWARIIEGGASSIDLTNVARLSRKRRAVQIYRSKRGGEGQIYRRGGDEGKPGYYMTIPFVWGRAVRRENGKIDLTEIFERRRYNTLGAARKSSLSRTDARQLRHHVHEYEKDVTRMNELEDDPDGAYDGKRFWERTGAVSQGASRFRLDGGGDPRNDGSEPRPGPVISRDPRNNRLLVSRIHKPDGPTKRQLTNEDGEWVGYIDRWVKGDDGKYIKEKVAVPKDDPSMDQFETEGSAEFRKKTGGAHLRLGGADASGERRGDVVRFRRVSTRGTAPLKPIPARPGYHLLRKAAESYREAVAGLIRDIEAHPATGRGLSARQQGTLSVLRRA